MRVGRERAGKRTGTVVMLTALVAFAATLAGCPDWDSFTRGYPDAGRDAPAPTSDVDSGFADGGADATNATTDAALTPVITIDYEVEPTTTYDLTTLGLTDWMELHESDLAKTNRCQPCTQAISPLDTKDHQIFNYSEDGRIFRWSNGKPTENGQSKGGVYVEDVGASFNIVVTANGQRQLLTMHTDTYYAGAAIRASMDGLAPASKKIEVASDQLRYAIRIHFVGAPGAKLAMSFTESAVLPVTVEGDKPNIAFNAVTLAPDN